MNEKSACLDEIKIEINEKFKEALSLMENSQRHIFITGKAGTGKSTLLNYFRSKTYKKIAVLAPTGVAALNVKGETIHSFFGFKPDITLQKIHKFSEKRTKIYKNIDTIVIDEVSMLRADLLDCIDHFLRINGRNGSEPFGGVQMVFIGDLYQLSPVVTNDERRIFEDYYKGSYFFYADAFDTISLEFVELDKIYRQKEKIFIGLLNGIRNNTINEEELSLLNERVGNCFPQENSREGFTIYLTTTNDMATRINNEYLERTESEYFRFEAEVTGNFNERAFPTDSELYIGKGSQVMLLNNDAEGQWINGTLGEVIDIEMDSEDRPCGVVVRFADGQIKSVMPHTWEIFHFKYNEPLRAIETEVIGTFTQLPLRLAWAVTIHKSQGKTFDRVIIDTGRGIFAHGQMYVALSRCTSLEGILLKKPVKQSDILMDPCILDFLARCKSGHSGKYVFDPELI
ncbi:MAG: DEAD/DEAH box helicase [Elusimicrobia bacterium]|nr:DEAD/DEAH box helicase [Elusimicrobiota bacterium]